MRLVRPPDSLSKLGSLHMGRSWNGLKYSNIWADYCQMMTITQAMRANFVKALRCWVQVSRVLRSENASSKVCGVFNKAKIQAVLLFRIEMWKLAPLGMVCLEGFHLRAPSHMSDSRPQKRPDSTWK
jgi:hypothetical protein